MKDILKKMVKEEVKKFLSENIDYHFDDIKEKYVDQGMVDFEAKIDGTTLLVNKLNVQPEYRNKGIGTDIINSIINKANVLNLKTILLNIDALEDFGEGSSLFKVIDFYKSFGFVVHKRESKYNEVVMYLKL